MKSKIILALRAAMSLNKESNEMVTVADAGDDAATKVQLGKVGSTRKGCLNDFKSKL